MKLRIIIFSLLVMLCACDKSNDEVSYEHNYGSFTDPRDGTKYRTIQIGNQVWMADNLAYLPKINSVYDLSKTQARYYVYAFSETGHEFTIENAKQSYEFNTHGVLYNWAAAKESVPIGWRLPTKSEFENLIEYIEKNYDGTKSLKSISGWREYTSNLDPNGNNQSGFDARPSGYVNIDKSYELIGHSAYFWSSTRTNEVFFYPWFFYITGGHTDVGGDKSDSYGFSVRCVKITD